MLQLLFVVALVAHGGLAFITENEKDDYDLWRRGLPSPATTPAECKKDIIVLWDNSQSVGIGPFTDKVVPFLKQLIKNPQLNVGKDGTHLGFVTFSTEVKTRMLLDVGQIQDPDKLANWVDGLDYMKDLLGDGTRTGLGFKITSGMFNKPSPGNYRPDVDDVVLLFTDGEPVIRRGENKFGFPSEKEMADHYAEELKKKAVTVIGLGVGSQSQLQRFFDDIKGWASSPKHAFQASADNLGKVVDKLVKASCIGPGECTCSTIETELYTEPNENSVLANWIKPDLKCDRPPQDLTTTVSPPGYNPPMRLNRGSHKITYTYTYKNGDKIDSRKCFVNLDIGACKCSATQTVEGKLKAGKTKAFVSWDEPSISCPATLKKVQPSSGWFPVGRHSVVYEYRYESEAQESFDFTCSVNIIVKGKFCGEVTYDPAQQVCCCGKRYTKKPGYKCCGPHYHDPGARTCCSAQEAILVDRGQDCP